MEKKLNIAFVGMSHLGLNYLAASSEKGFKVIGFDFNQNKINKLNKFDIGYEESNLKEIIIKNKKNIIFTSDFNILKNCNIVFISQDISTNSKGKSNIISLKKLIRDTSMLLNKNSLLVILSQVKPGFTRMLNFDHTRLYYQVETLIFGSAFERALKPERFIIGCKRPEFKIKSNFLYYLKKFNCPIIKMKYESAELTKISINILLASSIITSNVLAQACEKISADWYEIMPALYLDKRIGNKAYIKPGLGISGGNLERDIYSIQKILKKSQVPLSIIKAFQTNSKYMKTWVYRILKKKNILSKKNNLNIGILGLAYKENTNSIKNSPALQLLKQLKNNKIIVYDPKVKLKNKPKNCFQVNNASFLIKRANVIILMTPWAEFKKIGRMLKIKKKKIILIDPYRVVDFKTVDEKYIEYFTIGK